jgi:hypothetical protein
MSGKTHGLTPLETRKQLLLVESELNRMQLVNELREFKSEYQELKKQVHALRSIMSSATTLTETFNQIRSVFTQDEKKPAGSSWLSGLVNGAKTCASIFGAFRRPK